MSATRYIIQTLVFINLLLISFISSAQQLVMRGDHADPSVVKIGDSYWASATTSNWFPAYPLLESKDLVHWTPKGYVFTKMPDWADYYFWAPEIDYENGKVYIYYAAHKKNGNLCIAVASADKPEGPYTDHGPLMCEADGSIDAFPMRDENGKLFIIWKEDGNSVKQPTPIWIQEMNEERTALLGEKKELFRNTETWEANLVEGVSMIKKNGYFYAFYAAAGCCTGNCTYQTGIARSKSLLGPWEKYSRNPVLKNTSKWNCPGHGTPIEKDGRYYFLYHGYDKNTNVYTGRQGLLQEFVFDNDGWIKFVENTGAKDVPLQTFKDDFSKDSLDIKWQWSVFKETNHQVKDGKLQLLSDSRSSVSYIGIATTSGAYTATVNIDLKSTTAEAGIGVIGDDKNLISLQHSNGTLKVLSVENGTEKIIASQKIKPAKKLYLRAQVRNGKDIQFFYSYDGNTFKPVNKEPANGSFLPPWDRSLRAGLISKGDSGNVAVFNNFELRNL